MKRGLIRFTLTGAIACAFFGATVPEANHPIHVAGTLERVEANDLVVKLRRPKDGQTEVAIPTDSNTTFDVNGDLGTLADLQSGMGISARESTLNGGDAKSTLMVIAKSAGVSGKLVKVVGTTITIEVPQPGGDPKLVEVQTDDKTRIVVIELQPDGTPPPKLADLKPGIHVRSVPDIGVSKKIIIMPTHP